VGQALSGGGARSWWQWFLLYPTAAVALFSAAPSWLDRALAVWHGAESGSYAAAERQIALWSKNATCSQTPYAWYRNPRHVQVDATICDSGDVLVRAQAPGGEVHFQWIEVEPIVGGQAGGGQAGGGLSLIPQLIPQAHAATISSPFGPASLAPPEGAPGARLFRAYYQSATIVCQRQLDGRRLLRHVRTPGGCFDEVIDMLNGVVVQRTPVPCRGGC
jgi:hypothetical protein